MLQLLKLTKSEINIGNVPISRYINKTHKCFQNNYLWSKTICFCKNYGTDFTIDEDEQKRKTFRIPKITLIHPDKSTSVSPLEAAEKYAKRRGLKLVEVCDKDPKSNRSVYKLLTSTEYFEVNGKDDKFRIEGSHSTKRKPKTTKLFAMKCKIENHDLDIKINNINVLLEKGHKIKVMVTHPDGGQESILKSLNERIKGTVSAQKLQKTATTLTFSAPSKDNSSERKV